MLGSSLHIIHAWFLPLHHCCALQWHNFTYLPSWPEKDAQLFLLAFTLTLLQVSGQT